MASKKEKNISDRDSVKLLADSFMAGWLAIEAGRASDSETTEVALVNRMVQLVSAYLISKLLRDLEAGDAVVGGSATEVSLVRWQKVLQGWGTSIESRDLSSTSLKLLKMVVLLEKLRICQRKMQNFKTYSQLSKVLFCVSKYSELKDTRQQGELVELFAEAKALEAISLVRIKDRQQCSEHWDAREMVFFQNTRRTVLHVISEKLKVPDVFESYLKELATKSHTPSVVSSHEGSVEKETLPLPPTSQASVQLQVMGEEEGGSMEISEDVDVYIPDLTPVADLDLRDEPSSIPVDSELPEGKDEEMLQALVTVSKEVETAATKQQSRTGEQVLAQWSASSDVHHLGKEEEESGKEHDMSSPLPEMLPLSQAQYKREQEATGPEVTANADVDNQIEEGDIEVLLEDESLAYSSSPSSVQSANTSPTSILQMPYVRETVEWSSDESFDLKAEAEHKSKRLHIYPPLKVRGISGSGASGGGGSGSNITSSSAGGRVRWAEEEVEYLKEGVEKFGVGHWRTILENYPFHSRRSNVDLKDKWRNLQKKQ